MKKILFVLVFCLVACNVQAQVCGCTDARANNYNPQATVNDGSCTYASTSISTFYTNNLPTRLNGTSGLLYFDGKLFTHNDHSDCKIFRIDTTNGTIIDSVQLPNILHSDVEDIDQDEHYIYFGDCGNNVSGNRTNLHILRIEKNSFLAGNPIIDTIWFSYANQTDFTATSSNGTDFDCEAFIVAGDSVYLFTKQWVSEKSAIYVFPKTPGTHVARFISEYDVDGLITSATYNAEKQYVVLTGYSSLLQPFLVLLYDYQGNDFFSGNKRKIKLSLSFHQVEAIAGFDDYKFYLTNEYITKYGVTINAKFHKIDLSAYLAPTEPITSTITTEKSTLKIYPNPVKNKIFIAGNNLESGKYEIFNVLGKRITKGRFSNSCISLPLRKIDKGTYVLKIFANDKTYVQTFVKED